MRDENTIGVAGVGTGARIVAAKVLTRSGSASGAIAGSTMSRPMLTPPMSPGGEVSQALDSAVVSAALNSAAEFTLAAGNESDNADGIGKLQQVRSPFGSQSKPGRMAKGAANQVFTAPSARSARRRYLLVLFTGTSVALATASRAA